MLGIWSTYVLSRGDALRHVCDARAAGFVGSFSVDWANISGVGVVQDRVRLHVHGLTSGRSSIRACGICGEVGLVELKSYLVAYVGRAPQVPSFEATGKVCVGSARPRRWRPRGGRCPLP